MNRCGFVGFYVNNFSACTPNEIFIDSENGSEADLEAWFQKTIENMYGDGEEAAIESMMQEVKEALHDANSSFIPIFESVFTYDALPISYGGQEDEQQLFEAEERNHEGVMFYLHGQCEKLNIDTGKASWEEILTVLERIAPERIEGLHMGSRL